MPVFSPAAPAAAASTAWLFSPSKAVRIASRVREMTCAEVIEGDAVRPVWVPLRVFGISGRGGGGGFVFVVAAGGAPSGRRLVAGLSGSPRPAVDCVVCAGIMSAQAGGMNM